MASRSTRSTSGEAPLRAFAGKLTKRYGQIGRVFDVSGHLREGKRAGVWFWEGVFTVPPRMACQPGDELPLSLDDGRGGGLRVTGISGNRPVRLAEFIGNGTLG
jgi:hypothetical protein